MWLIRTTARPRSAIERASFSTCIDSRTPSAAVGSSISIARVAQKAARATATACRWPPERCEIGTPVSRGMLTPSVADLLRCPSPHGGAVEHAEWLQEARAHGLTTEEQIRDDVAVRCEREILEHDLDAPLAGGERVTQGDPLAPDVDLPCIGSDRPAQHLHQGRLAGTVVADDGRDLTGPDLDVHVVDRRDRPVALAQALALEDDLALAQGARRLVIPHAPATPELLVDRDRDDQDDALR